MKPLWTGSELLHKLLTDYLDSRISTALFCDNFEFAFNFDVAKAALTHLEHATFERLFDEVVYFSPLSEERATLPNYRSEQQIRQAALAARLAMATDS